MRVLHINCNYVGSTLHQLMIEELDNLGIENEVFVPVYNKGVSIIEPNDNVFLSECFKKRDRLVFDYKQEKIMREIEKHYDISSYDVIHAYTLFTDGNVARRLSKKYSVPYVVAVRNTDVNDFFRLMLHLRRRGANIMRDAAAVFFLSDAYRRQVFEKYIPKKYLTLIKEKTHIIPNGIDSFWIENTPPQYGKKIDKKAIHLIYAGRIDKNKNVPTTQKAMTILRNQGYEATLSVVGKIQDKKEFQTIIKDPFTTYYPAMQKNELSNLYRNSDIFVMPSFTESFGLVYAEAMSQGLPVVYTKGQGFDKQFAEGVVGYHVIANSPTDIYNAIIRIIDNYTNIQKNVVSSAKEFSWAKLVKEYERIYNMIVEKRM